MRDATLRMLRIKLPKEDQGVIDVPVRFAGVQFNPGDYVYADEDGVVVSDRALTL